jgi:predicted amidohydrolase YtcJ
LILDNVLVHTLDAERPRLRSLGVDGERIGREAGERIDLGGCTVVPGFTDAHVHFPMWAGARRQVQLDGARSLAEAVARVGAAGGDGWILGHGWRSAAWEREPTCADLDAVSGGRPAALRSKDAHSLWLNSAALALAGGDLAVPGGVVEVDEQGAATGVLREESAWRFYERHVTVSEAEQLDAMREGIAVAHARGVTSVHDKDGGRGALPLWQELRRTGELTLRVWQSLPADRLDALEEVGLRAPLGDEFLRVGYLKAFMDGALGSGTALLLDGSGVCITSSEELERIVRRAARLGWPVAVHAIGDRANRNALDAFERSRDEWLPRGLRQRIEHAQLLHPDDVGRFGALGVACSVQFTHAPSDRELVDAAWGGLESRPYPFRSLWESGAVVVNGSDAPIEELDPLAGLQAAVRRSLDERPPWRAEEALAVEQALRATTVNAAWLCGDERRRGRLAPGFLADLVVLDRDPFTCPPEQLAQIEVVATMVGGRWVHGAEALAVDPEAELAAR